ncbi:hypothetical protein B0H14DRAFT_2594828 [Mycena olivaceomarginata]|nr:hypothetical protein B0H14DRAFT_2594828 [Mycena olivaceomarginata]
MSLTWLLPESTIYCLLTSASRFSAPTSPNPLFVSSGWVYVADNATLPMLPYTFKPLLALPHPHSRLHFPHSPGPSPHPAAIPARPSLYFDFILHRTAHELPHSTRLVFGASVCTSVGEEAFLCSFVPWASRTPRERRGATRRPRKELYYARGTHGTSSSVDEQAFLYPYVLWASGTRMARIGATSRPWNEFLCSRPRRPGHAWEQQDVPEMNYTVAPEYNMVDAERPLGIHIPQKTAARAAASTRTVMWLAKASRSGPSGEPQAPRQRSGSGVETLTVRAGARNLPPRVPTSWGIFGSMNNGRTN